MNKIGSSVVALTRGISTSTDIPKTTYSYSAVLRTSISLRISIFFTITIFPHV
jgi:hypothetical protein